jgi:hypothetical protein
VRRCERSPRRCVGCFRLPLTLTQPSGHSAPVGVGLVCARALRGFCRSTTGQWWLPLRRRHAWCTPTPESATHRGRR